MELRAYIQIIQKNIQLIVIFTLVSVTLTLLFTTQQTPVYESISTYVTRVSPGLALEDTIYIVDTLTGRQRIYVGFCDVMESGRVRENAIALFEPDTNLTDIGDYETSCTVLPESNVIMLKVTGTEPQVVRALNQVIGIAGVEFNNGTYGGFIEMDLLDHVWFNPMPISPNYVFNGVLGLALGIAVSVTIVFLLDYLRSPAERLAESSIYEVRLNVYNNRYATRRLSEEIERSKMQNRLLAVALIELHSDVQDGISGELLLRQAAMRLREKLRPTDILAHREGGTFTLIMPETTERTALRLVRTIHEHMAAKPVEVEGAIANFTAITGMIENNGGMYDNEHIMELAERALRTARRAGLNTIEFVRTKPSPFVVDGTEVEFHQFKVTDEYRSVMAEDTEVPGVHNDVSGSSPSVGDKTQPIFFDPDSNPFEDDTDQLVPPRRTNQSVLDKIAQRNRDTKTESSATFTATALAEAETVAETDEDVTQVGPFAVPSKKVVEDVAEELADTVPDDVDEDETDIETPE